MSSTESSQVTYYLPKWLAEEVKAKAKASDRSASFIVRSALAENFAAQDAKRPRAVLKGAKP